MKLAFSTLGCPDWRFSELFSTAKDLGYSGIEVRGIKNQIYVPKIPEFSEELLTATMEKLRGGNLQIPIFTSGAVIGVEGRQQAGRQEAFDYIDLARRAGVPYVRVLVTPNPYPENTDLTLCKKIYGEICDYAKADGEAPQVIPLIETNGALANSTVLKEFLAQVGRPNMGVLWDIHHPYRFFHETPQETFSHIGPYVRHVHVKDSVIRDGHVEYRMMGYGDVPVFDCLEILKKHDYTEYISLEWVKRWCPELQEPGIVFSHFVNYMRVLLNQL